MHPHQEPPPPHMFPHQHASPQGLAALQVPHGPPMQPPGLTPNSHGMAQAQAMANMLMSPHGAYSYC
jgi:hypothetical protein